MEFIVLNKKIAITQRIIETQEYVELRDALSHDWMLYLQQCGYTPLLIPSQILDVVSYVKMFGCDGIILSNGESVKLKKNDLGEWVGSDRDVMEAKLLDWAIQRDVPVLGVCRGMQLINCYFGGQLKKNIKGHVTESHRIDIIMDYFQEFYGTDTTEVNSYHCMGITKSSLGKGLSVWAKQEDIIEGFIHNTFPILGIEWHPERVKPMNQYDKTLILKFFNKEFCIKNPGRLR